MKIIYCLIISTFSFYSFTQKDEGLKLLFIDGYTNLPMDNYEIDFSINGKTFKRSNKSNSEGMYVLEDFKGKKIKLDAKTNDNKFFPIKSERKLSKDENGIIKIHFYPTSSYEERMFAIEDSIYGPVTYNFNKAYQEADAFVEGDAYFIGGSDSFQLFIQTNVIYPYTSIIMNEQGECRLHFVVEKDGKITHVKVGDGVSFDIDNEAKRLLRSSPLWSPGKDENTFVRTRCRIPINFVLR